jgi:hypothetical protein
MQESYQLHACADFNSERISSYTYLIKEPISQKLNLGYYFCVCYGITDKMEVNTFQTFLLRHILHTFVVV